MICNHCGKEITEYPQFSRKKNKSIKVKQDGEWIVANLCDECYVKLLQIIQQFCIRKDDNK